MCVSKLRIPKTAGSCYKKGTAARLRHHEYWKLDILRTRMGYILDILESLEKYGHLAPVQLHALYCVCIYI